MRRSNDVISEHARLKRLTKQNLFRLIETEFTLAFTLADLAETEVQLGNLERARRLLSKAGSAIDSNRRHLASAQLSDAEKAEIRRQLEEIEPRLAEVADASQPAVE